MKTFLEDIIQSIYILPPDVLEDVMDQFQYREYLRNHYLLRSGNYCRNIWFIVKGTARSFYTDQDGKETNTWFSMDGHFITETTSLVKQERAQESIQLIEDTELFSIDYTTFQLLTAKHHLFAIWYIKLLESYYIPNIEQRISDLQFLDARERYQKLLQMYPEILQRVSLGNIASYLKVTQETISRIRAVRI